MRDNPLQDKQPIPSSSGMDTLSPHTAPIISIPAEDGEEIMAEGVFLTPVASRVDPLQKDGISWSSSESALKRVLDFENNAEDHFVTPLKSDKIPEIPSWEEIKKAKSKDVVDVKKKRSLGGRFSTISLRFIDFVAVEANWYSWRDGASAVDRLKIIEFAAVISQIESFLMVSSLVCLDRFLFYFTFFPYRILVGLIHLFECFIRRRNVDASRYCDLVQGMLLVGTVVLLYPLNTAALYHFIRGQNVLKLYVILSILEVLDRLSASFGHDILDATYSAFHHGSVKKSFFHFIISLLYNTIHCCILYIWAVTLNVAVNTQSSSLLTLLVSNQFLELKSTVFKRFRSDNLFQVACGDVVERFQLSLMLLFTFLHNVNFDVNSVGWPFWEALSWIWLSELIVDWIKHCFLAKFNNIPHQDYRNFRRVVSQDVLLRDRQGEVIDHTRVCRRLGFVALPQVSFIIKTMIDVAPAWSVEAVLLCSAFYLTLIALKMCVRINLLGYVCSRFEKEGLFQDHLLERTDRYSLTGSRIP